MRGAFLAIAALAFATAPARAAEVAVSDIGVMPIHDGVNRIPRFTPDGRTATVVRGWRDNGNAHGHYVYLVLLPTKEEPKTSGVVTVTSKDGLDDTIGASPFDGERVLQTVRFARAKIDGKAATVMIRADLGEAKSGVLADHAPVVISIYRLETPGVEVGTSPDLFRLVKTIAPPGGFCSADMALATVLRLPLPADYAGGKAPGGCVD
jgi:hypothetical protein